MEQATRLEFSEGLSTASDLISSFRSMRNSSRVYSSSAVPHQGALCRYEDTLELKYVIEIALEEHSGLHELFYTRNDFEFAQRLFAILDTESRGYVGRAVVKEFVTLRCPVFWRRDDDIRSLTKEAQDSPTFDEIWKSVVCCSRTTRIPLEEGAYQTVELGVEGWMVFCRFIALAQYLEAKRRFLARHSQQTMRHRNAPRGSEVVVVDVPPPEPPALLSPQRLACYEQKSKTALPLPELDLDHSLVAAHDLMRRRASNPSPGEVRISLFGPSFSSSLLHSTSGSSSSSKLEFAVTFAKRPSMESSRTEELVVRRSMADMKWLNDTFASHKTLGGTLCGRILPPFPGTSNGLLSSHFQSEDFVLNSSIKSTGDAITAAAAATVGSSVGIIRDVASFFGNYMGGATSSLVPSAEDHGSHATAKKKASKKASLSRVLPESYYNPNSPAGKARQLERYLNYLLEHPALSTSFPLNTILKASQSGLEAAKLSLEECTRTAKELKAQAPQLDDASSSPNLAWVRTAAQAAMALKVHGMLETTGMNSASARLQHASLPLFDARNAGWEDEEGASMVRRQVEIECAEEAASSTSNNFEDGVVSVRSELLSEEPMVGDDGYDLLPLPVPAPERRILSAGSDSKRLAAPREIRFHYGTNILHDRLPVAEEENTRDVLLGDMLVDENIDKLREVIGSVDNTLSRCLTSSGTIGKSQCERQGLHLAIVRGLDSWAGMRGKFVSQRSLLKGVAGIEQSKEIYEEGDVALIDDISWQTSLASSAVAAAEDVRSAVRVSRTAANAKAAASSAAYEAQNACDNGEFVSIDEARAARTRASIAQSHAIHAAVVEHEAKTVKRRATLALAHDVKCWNVHRKREMLRSCMAYARSQHEATRRAVDAWSSLRDGFIGTTVIPAQRQIQTPPIVQQERRQPQTDPNEVTATLYADISVVPNRELSRPSEPDLHDPTSTIYPEALQSSDQNGESAIVAVDHPALGTAKDATRVDEASKSDSCSMDLGLPFAAAAPIPEDAENELLASAQSAHSKLVGSRASSETENAEFQETMSASMQSLVNGLMSWGGGIETEEDHFALPLGMAASIALEESGVLGPPKLA